MIAGLAAGSVTVNVADCDVAVPRTFVTPARKRAPVSFSTLAGVVYDADVAPVTGDHVLPPSVLLGPFWVAGLSSLTLAEVIGAET